jgi:hypothetical protein
MPWKKDYVFTDFQKVCIALLVVVCGLSVGITIGSFWYHKTPEKIVERMFLPTHDGFESRLGGINGHSYIVSVEQQAYLKDRMSVEHIMDCNYFMAVTFDGYKFSDQEKIKKSLEKIPGVRQVNIDTDIIVVQKRCHNDIPDRYQPFSWMNLWGQIEKILKEKDSGL